jgi:GTP-binding protein
MFVDEITIHAKAGRGGNGVVLWRHEKGKELSGAAGGNGGVGGSIYLRAVNNIGLLSQYRHKKSFVAENGEQGMRNSKTGKDGENLTIDLPVGSVITEKETGRVIRLDNLGETRLLLSGGAGGYGNEHFKSSTNTSPYESTPGKDGEEGRFLIELELIVDAGIIGLPNAGKSSLLNAITNAKAKVGAFAFTTIEPNLGDLNGRILADIPGLIEGASTGKGLGDKFLKHIRRTKSLIHCISVENDDVEKAYETVRTELSLYDKSLLEKPECIVLTKLDTVSPDTAQELIKKLKLKHQHVFGVTILDDESTSFLKKELLGLLEN